DDPEIVAGDDRPPAPIGPVLLAYTQRQPEPAEGREDRVLVAHGAVERPGEPARPLVERPGMLAVAERHERGGAGDRKGTEDDPVDQREDRRGGTDAERERQDRGDREHRTASELAECIAQVTRQR